MKERITILSVVIVNWNRRDCLKSLLEDIRLQTCKNYEILVIDNGSEDLAYEVPIELHIETKIIRLHKNCGLSFGRNIGIVNAKGNYLFFPDNDLRLPDPELFEKAVKFLDEKNYAVASCKQLEEMNSYNRKELLTKDVADYWFLTGGAAFFKRKMFDVVGLFDDTFLYGGEEWDLAFKVHSKQLLMAKNDNLVVVHAPHKTGRFAKHRLMILENMMFAQLRYMPIADAFFLLLWQTIIVFGRSICSLRPWDFLHYGFVMVFKFKRMVLMKRNKVDKKIMGRWYALRLIDEGKMKNYSEIALLEYYKWKLSVR